MCLSNDTAQQSILLLYFFFVLAETASIQSRALADYWLLSNVFQKKPKPIAEQKGWVVLPCFPQRVGGQRQLCRSLVGFGVKPLPRLKAAMCAGPCIPFLTLCVSLGSAARFLLFFFFLAEAGKIDSLAGDVPVSTVGFFLFLQLRWRSTGDKRISAASLGGEGSGLLRKNTF